MKTYRITNVIIGILLSCIGLGISKHLMVFGILMTVLGVILSSYNLKCIKQGY